MKHLLVFTVGAAVGYAVMWKLAPIVQSKMMAHAVDMDDWFDVFGVGHDQLEDDE